MRFRIAALATGLILVAAIMLGGASSADAQTFPWIKITGGPIVDTCNSISFGVPVDVNIGTTGSDFGKLTVPGYGAVWSYWEDHSGIGPIVGPASYGVNPSPYSVAANTILMFEVSTYAGPSGSGGLTSYSWIKFDCTTGGVVNSYFGSGAFEEVPVPTGFMQHEILCDSPVFDMPGGTQVGDNMVRAGQAWYVNPTPVSGPAGELWTEIHVAGENTGYIRTSCVGGPTPFN